ncbi:hypothetical protein B0T24DRAFT_334502 [Lasiosphaeria ovina]|uniref:Uncharacterized protein n=1 Tax=Lasiosphaeria ovina TaxID=92902 RepID=A0AAE0N5R2_9PEZI|nr:hypothetical protein B0T24DRAFT_334502 [Lasiosphaeria ovina]
MEGEKGSRGGKGAEEGKKIKPWSRFHAVGWSTYLACVYCCLSTAVVGQRGMAIACYHRYFTVAVWCGAWMRGMYAWIVCTYMDRQILFPPGCRCFTYYLLSFSLLCVCLSPSLSLSLSFVSRFGVGSAFWRDACTG